MADQLQTRILSHLKSEDYRPQQPRGLAKELDLNQDEHYPAFRDALKELMHAGRVVLGSGGAVVLPGQAQARDEFAGTYRHNKRGFGFVVPTDPGSREDLFIPEGENAGALNGDSVRARITNREQRDGKVMYRGRVTEIVQRSQNKFVGTLTKQGKDWVVLPDGNTLSAPIYVPDAASRHVKPGTKVVVELTQFPDRAGLPPVGVITDVLGKAGEKDVDLKSVIVQFNLPGDFPEEVKEEARQALAKFDPEAERERRLDITDQVICTIDPPDAKDYDDAISLRHLDSGHWELGVHIADVAYFVTPGSALDTEAAERGNSCYFPGHVIPMLPEVLSNGVCSLQEGVPRLCKSVFITYDEDAQPVGTKFANTVIKSRKRLRYIEAQAIIDAVTTSGGRHRRGDAEGDAGQPAGEQRRLVPLYEGGRLQYDPAAAIPHPDGDKRVSDYPREVVELIHQMNVLSKRIHKRRQANGQINLDLPEVDLVLDEEGKVVDAVPEDQSFTHTLIEMFMVEANEAAAKVLDSVDVPYLRRAHPTPDLSDSERLRQFVQVAGYKIPKDLDRKAIQVLLASVKGRPEAFALNLAVLRSLTRAEYSPEPVGHYALASEAYAHFTSPIRRYADLTVHRLLDQYIRRRDDAGGGVGTGGRKRKRVAMEEVPTHDELVEVGRHISFTERRADDAERELRQVKILELLGQKLGAEYLGVITGITNFGVFVQIQPYLIDGLIRYENLMDDWWDVDAKAGRIRGQRTGKVIAIGDAVKAIVARVDPPRRELDLSISQLLGRGGAAGGQAGDQRPGDGKPGGMSKHKKGRHKQDEKPRPAAGGGGGGRRGKGQPQQPARGGEARPHRGGGTGGGGGGSSGGAGGGHGRRRRR